MAAGQTGGTPGYKKAAIAVIVLLLGVVAWSAGQFESLSIRRDNDRPARTQTVEPYVDEPAPYVAPLDPSEVPDEIRYGVPYRGMDVRFMSSTGLGSYDYSTMVGEHPNYVWHCVWQPEEISCIVSCDDGQVTFVILHEELVRLPSPPEESDTLAEEDAEAHAETSSQPEEPHRYAPDPFDYDDPDDYARDYEEWATEDGSWYGGIYDDAYEEWVVEVADDESDW